MSELILAGRADHHAEPWGRHREAARKARDAEICAWLRGKDNGYPEGAGYRDAADAIERGEV